MKRFLILSFLLVSLGLSAQTNKMETTFASPFTVEATMQRIKSNLEKMNVPVFALFDHAKNAEAVGMELRPTQVIVFGAPAVGTKLMQRDQRIALELPLKIAVWQDAEGKVWASFKDMRKLAAEYQMENHPVVGKMQTMLEELVKKSTDNVK